MSAFDNGNIIINHFRFKISQFIQSIELYQEFSSDSKKEDLTPEKKELLSEIKIRFVKENNTIEDFFSIEKQLLAICPAGCLRDYKEDSVRKYLEILPNEAVKKLDSLGSDDNDDEKLRSNTMKIVSQIHKYYHFVNNKEKFISRYKILFIVLFMTLIAIYVLFLLIVRPHPMMENAPLSTVSQIQLAIEMVCAGYFGAIISVAKRIQDMAVLSVDGVDREDVLLKIATGRWGIILSLLLGSLSPFILLLLVYLLAGHSIDILGVPVIPKLCNSETDCSNLGSAHTAAALLLNLSFKTPIDLAVFILLSIACGFTERFVPDVLDRVSQDFMTRVDKPTQSNQSNTKKPVQPEPPEPPKNPNEPDH